MPKTGSFEKRKKGSIKKVSGFTGFDTLLTHSYGIMLYRQVCQLASVHRHASYVVKLCLLA
ncbi:hypothetical protein QY96_01126 [Bacillus thermotolerans]|nr:hypothetical protein QY96_01126 [Bacillus thermotolerans]